MANIKWFFSFSSSKYITEYQLSGAEGKGCSAVTDDFFCTTRRGNLDAILVAVESTISETTVSKSCGREVCISYASVKRSSDIYPACSSSSGLTLPLINECARCTSCAGSEGEGASTRSGCRSSGLNINDDCRCYVCCDGVISKSLVSVEIRISKHH